MQGINEAKCYAAGTITLDARQQTLIAISNKSGDFTPDYSCLGLLLATFFIHEDHLPFKLPQQLSVLKFNKKLKEVEHKFELTDLKNWAKRSISEELQIHLVDQPKTIMKHLCTAAILPARLPPLLFSRKQIQDNESLLPNTPRTPF